MATAPSRPGFVSTCVLSVVTLLVLTAGVADAGLAVGTPPPLASSTPIASSTPLPSPQPAPQCAADTPTSCSYDRIVCKGGCFPNKCEEYTPCAEDKPIYPNWNSAPTHACACGVDRNGTDCSLIRPNHTAISHGRDSWCDDGYVWTGEYTPLANEARHVQCFIDLTKDQEKLNFRLHHVTMELGSQPSGRAHYTLSSRHLDESVDKCTPITKDIDCELADCSGVTIGDSYTYSCNWVNCTSETGTTELEFLVALLNTPSNWPLNLNFTNIVAENGTSEMLLKTAILPIHHHCYTGQCVAPLAHPSASPSISVSPAPAKHSPSVPPTPSVNPSPPPLPPALPVPECATDPGAHPTSCDYDQTVCTAGCYPANMCQEYTQCPENVGGHYTYPYWNQAPSHSCLCGPDRNGTDCSIVRPPHTAQAYDGRESWCNTSSVDKYWNGYFTPLLTAPREVECFVDLPHQEILSVRLHRVTTTVFPDSSLRWTLHSRHTLPKPSPYEGLCAPVSTDLDCHLSECDLSTSPNCTDVKYNCHYINCTTQTGTETLRKLRDELNDFHNWPILFEYAGVSPENGTAELQLHTPQLNIHQHCYTGRCLSEEPACHAVKPTPAPSKPPSWKILAPAGVVGAMTLGGIVVVALVCFTARPSRASDVKAKKTASKPTPEDESMADAQFHRLEDGDGAGFMASPSHQQLGASPMGSLMPTIGIIAQDISYDVTTQAQVPWSRMFSKKLRDQPTTKRVLNGVTVHIQPGEFVALMGPSGAGKSSLLDIFAGQRKSGKISGNLEYHWQNKRVNGLADGVASMQGIGYVYQDDRLMATETVRDTLRFSARMRLPRGYSEESINRRVEHVLRAMELDGIADSRVGSPDAGGGLSGGERKRLAIGVELLAQPRLLLLDEPTTGLDSTSAAVVMKVLAETARAGCTCVMSIHQPSSAIFRSFDKVVVLSTGGHLMYAGVPMEAVNHVVHQEDMPAPRIRRSTGGSAIILRLPQLSELPPVPESGGGGGGGGGVAGYGSSDETNPLRKSSAGDGGDDAADLDGGKGGAAERKTGEYRAPGLTLRHAGSGEIKTDDDDDDDDDEEGDVDDDDDDLMVNPAEVLLEVAASHDMEKLRGLAGSFRASTAWSSASESMAAVQQSAMVLDPALGGKLNQYGPTSTWADSVYKFSVLCGRGVRQMLRDPSLFITQVLLSIVVSVAIGVLFWDLHNDLQGVRNKTTGVFFFSVFYFQFASLSSISVLMTEKLTFFRERARRFYSTGPYFLSKVCVDLIPLRMLPPLLYGSVVYFMANLRSGGVYFVTFLLSLLLVNCATTAACYAISAWSPSASLGNLTATLFVVFNTLFGGVLLTGRSGVVRTVMVLSIANFGFQAMMINEFQDTNFVFNPKTPAGTAPVNVKTTANTWLKSFGINTETHPHLLATDIVALLVYWIVLLVGAFTLLAYHQKYVK